MSSLSAAVPPSSGVGLTSAFKVDDDLVAAAPKKRENGDDEVGVARRNPDAEDVRADECCCC